MKAVVAAFNQEKALEGAFSVLTNLRMELFQALLSMQQRHEAGRLISPSAGPRDIVTVTPEMLQCQGGVLQGEWRREVSDPWLTSANIC